MLVAEVIIGKCQTLITKDKGRQSADTGYNSVLVSFINSTCTRYCENNYTAVIDDN